MGPIGLGARLRAKVSNHYQAFADPRADGSIAGIQSGFDLWRGALFPWGRDEAGLFFAYSDANIDVNGLVTNAAATGYVLTKTGTLNLNAWSGGGAADRIRRDKEGKSALDLAASAPIRASLSAGN